MQNSLLVLNSSKDGWRIREYLKGYKPQAVAFDPLNSNRAYCGTFDNGLWKTDDGGQTWDKVRMNIHDSNIMSVSVSPLEQGNSGFSKVFVGTEPSALYVSNDGCESWQLLNALNNLESSRFWSFPPRPWTHHVRWIEPDIHDFGYLFVAIEAGALVRTHDGGKTWIDRVGTGPFDTHTLSVHSKVPKRLYSSAGDGYFESFDYGDSWKKSEDGLGHHYLYGLAVNSSDPHNVIVSASKGALKAHSVKDAESYIYRRSKDEERWNLVTSGLPEPKGTVISILDTNSEVGGEFYCLNNRGIFCSIDSGVSWHRLEIPWPKEYCLQHPWGISVKG
jgi:hypothetical protein